MSHLSESVVAVSPPRWDTRSSALAGGFAGGVTGFVYGEHVLARAIGRRLAIALPGGVLVWRMAAHGAAMAGLVAGGHALWNRAMRGLEPGALSTRVVEPGRTRMWLPLRAPYCGHPRPR
jgi:hypothetical protein